ncbi:ATP-binding cassette domain-containing protein [Flavobacterium myungsuense]|uniref:ATP-binding cassette domain-containing protein n=1 Tax=Flavobacterium myungsuense TaxID=651823 RepID=UPI00362BFD3F
MALFNKYECFKKTFFNQISIGQQRVVLIIRAIIKQPLLVIFDEPLEGLDDENVALVSQLITILRKETTITFICVSHRIESTLIPELIYELIPTDNGSIGKIKEVF